MTTPSFADHLAFIEERSAALRTAAAAAPAEARVPGCPEWHAADLVGHLGEVQRFWAAIVAAGPAAGPPEDVPGRTPEGDLLAWSAARTGRAGPGGARRARPGRWPGTRRRRRRSTPGTRSIPPGGPNRFRPARRQTRSMSS